MSPPLRLKDERGPGPPWGALKLPPGRRVDRAVALPGGGTRRHPCPDVSPTCWPEPSFTDSLAAEVLGLTPAGSGEDAHVDGETGAGGRCGRLFPGH